MADGSNLREKLSLCIFHSGLAQIVLFTIVCVVNLQFDSDGTNKAMLKQVQQQENLSCNAELFLTIEHCHS